MARLSMLFAALMSLVLLVSANAYAATYTLCVDIDTDYDDIGGSTWWTTNADRPARGIRIETMRETLPPVFDGGFANSDGCRTMTVDPAYTYSVLVKSWAKVSGISLRSYANHASGPEVTVVRTGWRGANLTESAVIPYDRVHGALAIAMWTMNRSTMGVSPDIPFDFYMDSCCSAGAEISVNIDSKKIITHEIGHAVAYRRDDNTNPRHDYGAPIDGCFGDSIGVNSHSLVQKEYTAAAAVEGWANFYAAWAWNTHTSSACTLDFQNVSNFDLDLAWDNDQPGQVGWVNCEGKPPFQSDPNEPATARDWLADLVGYPAPLPCVGPLENRSTEYDWMRFFWDMLTDEGLTPTQMATLYDDMNPRNWDPNGGGTTADDPESRLIVSALNNGWDAKVYAQDDNGQDH